VSLLDWAVAVTERIVVLAVTSIVFYVGWRIFHGDIQNQNSPLTQN